MAYSIGLLKQIEGWVDSGALPLLLAQDRVVDLGSQMINPGTPHAAVAQFIRKFNPGFDELILNDRFPVSPHYYAYVGEIWKLCNLDYVSYDVTEAPFSRVFDLNFHEVPEPDRGRAALVANIGTTEHIANQLNAFRTVHDLLKVGGIAIHSVPFAGMLNHALFNYHPKFFFSLIVNNRYRLRYVEFGGPRLHEALGPGNSIYDGDYLATRPELPGSGAWSETKLYSGMITLVVERRFPDQFVPPVDFARGYFGDISESDLSALIGHDLPHSAWADAYRRGTTPTQKPS